MSTLPPQFTTDQAIPSEELFARYSRQVLFDKIGIEGQKRLASSRAVLFGCGALGGVLANLLVRAGVGHLRLCDRDFVERNNLQRQILFDEEDVRQCLPKAQAAAVKLRQCNPDVTVEPIVADVNAGNIEQYAQGANLLLDGTDNFETRYLINDLAVKTDRPWIYGAVLGASGLCMTILPRDTPCLRCLFETAPPPDFTPTCDTAGVLAPAVGVVAGLQAIEAIKILIGRRDEINRFLLSIDAWRGRFHSVNVAAARNKESCPCCALGRFDYLAAKLGTTTATLCGRHAVQILSAGGRRLDLDAMSAKLSRVSTTPVTSNPYLVKARIDGLELTIFRDGRAIIGGTDDPDRARAVYARYVSG